MVMAIRRASSEYYKDTQVVLSTERFRTSDRHDYLDKVIQTSRDTGSCWFRILNRGSDKADMKKGAVSQECYRSETCTHFQKLCRKDAKI